MPLFDVNPDFARQEYLGFVSDFGKLLKQADSIERQLKNRPVGVGRGALPRPARFTPIKLGWLRDATASTKSNLRGFISDWVQNRFNDVDYYTVVVTAHDDGSPLGEAARSLLWNGNRLVLERSYAGPGYWIFGLTPDEAEGAENAMRLVRDIVKHALYATIRARAQPNGHFGRLVRAFFCRCGANFRPDEVAGIDEVFRSVQQLLLASPSTIVLCKADMRGGRSRASEAYVRPGPINLGARVFLGDSFFDPPAKGYQGIERWLYRGATLIHEFTHLVAGTEDVAADESYGRANCWQLPVKDQRRNADNFGLFAFEAARCMVLHHGTSLPQDLDFALKQFSV